MPEPRRGVSLGQGVAAMGRVQRGRGAAVCRGRRGAVEAGRGAGEGCCRDRRGQEWWRRGGVLSGQAWDEHAEATAAKEAEVASTEAKEQQSAAAKEA